MVLGIFFLGGGVSLQNGTKYGGRGGQKSNKITPTAKIYLNPIYMY